MLVFDLEEKMEGLHGLVIEKEDELNRWDL